jgi:hypothetical protein
LTSLGSRDASASGRHKEVSGAQDNSLVHRDRFDRGTVRSGLFQPNDEFFRLSDIDRLALALEPTGGGDIGNAGGESG